MVKGGRGGVDAVTVSVDDFFATPAASAPVASAVAVSPFTPVPRPPQPAPAAFPVRLVLAGAVVVLAVVVGLAVALWPHSSGSKGPDTGMAKLFGQQTRTQLPQPVQPEDCAAAVKAFPAIAADAAAKAAFIDGCLHP